jgi:glycosyltransferase involved in cell wall biosynthesis
MSLRSLESFETHSEMQTITDSLPPGQDGIATADAPVVSVAMLTCNHGHLLADALDSVLTQRVDFRYEIIIGDDASDASDFDVALDYAKRHPQVIRLLRNEHRQGVFANVVRTLAACRGEYIALLEGDDAWIHPDKLARQVDFLRGHPDYMGCFHDAWIRNDEVVADQHRDLPTTVARRYSDFNIYPREFHPWDLVARNVIPTASLVYRRMDLANDLEAFRDIDLSLSWLLELLVIRRSKFAYFDEAWAVYNNHSRGLTKRRSRSEFTQSNLKILRRLCTEDCYRHHVTHLYRAQVKELYFLFDQQLEDESTWTLVGTILRLLSANTRYSLFEAAAMLRKLRARKRRPAAGDAASAGGRR